MTTYKGEPRPQPYLPFNNWQKYSTVIAAYRNRVGHGRFLALETQLH